MTSTTLRLVSWNLDHRTTHKAIHPLIVRATQTLSPDVIFFNEYVEYPEHVGTGKCADRTELRGALADIGLRHSMISQGAAPRATGTFENRVIVFSRYSLEVGTIPPPESPYPTGSQEQGHRTNYLHVTVPDFSFDIIGFRAPDFGDQVSPASMRRTYWKNLLQRILLLPQNKSVIVGDFNLDPHGQRPADAEIVRMIRSVQHPKFSMPNPSGEFSYKTRTRSSRIDHALLIGEVQALRVEYVTALGSIKLAGTAKEGAISDHAPLVLDLEL